MKKIISLVLGLTMLTSVCSSVAGAADYTVKEDGNAYYETADGYVFNIDGIDNSVTVVETTRMCTSLDTVNTVWGIYVLLEKTAENVYVAKTDGAFMNQAAPAVTIGENQVLFVAHSASSNPELASQYPNWQDKSALEAVKMGDTFTFTGVDLSNKTVTNATAEIKATTEVVDKYPWAEKHTYEGVDATLPYRLALPESYDKSKTYPLVVFFHGAGERGNDNSLQMSLCVKYIFDNVKDAIIIAPQCPIGSQWVNTPWDKGAYSADSVPESKEMKAAMALVRQIMDDYSVDRDRVYATGLSMGGFAVWDVMVRHNDLFAAGIPVCGGGDASKGEMLKDTPLFVFHGTADVTVPFSGSEMCVNSIKAAGGNKVEFTVYEGSGHSIWDAAFATEGLFDKLLACKLSDRYVSEESAEESIPNESNAEESKSQEKTAFHSAYLIPIIAIAAIAVAVIVVLILKKK